MTAVALPDLEWQMELFGVTDDMLQIASEHYKVSDRMLEDGLKLFQEWFKMQPHFPKIVYEDRSAKRLISINKFSVERAKEKLENWLTARSVMPEFFSHRDPWSPDISKALDCTDWISIPKHTAEHYRVQVLRPNFENINDYDPIAAFGIISMILDIKLHLDIALGDIYICDLKHLTFAQTVKLTPVAIKKLMFLIQSCYATNVKGMHILNVPSYAEFVVNVLRACMKNKMAERLFVHKSMDDLFKVIPKELIPKDMGGDFPRISHDLAGDMRKAARSPGWREWFVDSANQMTDESRRSKQSNTTVDDLIGMMGSFRKLDID